MTYANPSPVGERELAAINASAEASSVFDADDWDDAVDAAEMDCALLRESLLSSASDEFE
jgi:hypothetical protein